MRKIFKIQDRRMIESISAIAMGAVLITGVPMNVRASAALGSSANVGISADLEAAADAELLESAMNDVVLDAFHLDEYSNLGIVTVSEGKVNIRDSLL